MAPIKWVAYDTDIECSKPEKFGMYHGQPCLMLKLNKVYGWEPEPYYNITEVSRQFRYWLMASLVTWEPYIAPILDDEMIEVMNTLK